MKAYVLNIVERCENMTTISLRMDDEMKKELDEMCEAMGMNISTFYMVYTKKALRERKIPFEIEAPQDPFYSKTNLEHIRESDRQIKEGKVVVKTMEELDEKYLEDGHIYMDAIPAKDFTPQVRKRVRYHNWFADKNVKNPFLWQLQNLTVNLQKVLGIRRNGIGEFKEDRLYKGLVYISLPRVAAEYVVHYCGEHTEFLKDLKDCQIPEEFFFQTILMNSSFAKKVESRPIRYMNWDKGDGGSPAYLELDDLPEIRQGDYDFARKFGRGISDALRRELFGGKELP